MINMGMDIGKVGNEGRTATCRKCLQTAVILGERVDKFANGVLINMNNGAAIAVLRFFVDHDFMQRKRWEEKESARTHGVLAIIDNDDPKTLFNIENFQTLMPVMVTHRIGKKAAERRDGIVECNKLQMLGIPG